MTQTERITEAPERIRTEDGREWVRQPDRFGPCTMAGVIRAEYICTDSRKARGTLFQGREYPRAMFGTASNKQLRWAVAA